MPRVRRTKTGEYGQQSNPNLTFQTFSVAYEQLEQIEQNLTLGTTNNQQFTAKFMECLRILQALKEQFGETDVRYRQSYRKLESKLQLYNRLSPPDQPQQQQQRQYQKPQQQSQYQRQHQQSQYQKPQQQSQYQRQHQQSQYQKPHQQSQYQKPQQQSQYQRQHQQSQYQKPQQQSQYQRQHQQSQYQRQPQQSQYQRSEIIAGFNDLEGTYLASSFQNTFGNDRSPEKYTKILKQIHTHADILMNAAGEKPGSQSRDVVLGIVHYQLDGKDHYLIATNGQFIDDNPQNYTNYINLAIEELMPELERELKGNITYVKEISGENIQAIQNRKRFTATGEVVHQLASIGDKDKKLNVSPEKICAEDKFYAEFRKIKRNSNPNVELNIVSDNYYRFFPKPKEISGKSIKVNIERSASCTACCLNRFANQYSIYEEKEATENINQFINTVESFPGFSNSINNRRIHMAYKHVKEQYVDRRDKEFFYCLDNDNRREGSPKRTYKHPELLMEKKEEVNKEEEGKEEWQVESSVEELAVEYAKKERNITYKEGSVWVEKIKKQRKLIKIISPNSNLFKES